MELVIRPLYLPKRTSNDIYKMLEVRTHQKGMMVSRVSAVIVNRTLK